MRKVLQLGKFHPIKGGVEKVMIFFARGLSHYGYESDMLCASDDGLVGEWRLSARGRLIKSRTVTKKAATMISPGMIRVMWRSASDYDLIHIHHPDPMAALALYLSGYKGKVVLHWHSDILKQKFLLRLYKPLQDWLIDRADLILGTSPVYVEQSPFLSKVQHKVSCLPIGVGERKVEDGQVEEIRSVYPGKKIIYSLGRLVEYKGYEYLIEAATMLGDDYVVLIGGGGPLKDKLNRKIAHLGLHHKVKLLGYIPSEVEGAYYMACDVFCLSSTLKTEAYAIVQVEAMSASKPIVATQIPGSGVSWVNEHGVSGLNVPTHDARAIASAIQEICSSPEVYTHYAQGARARYERYFRASDMIERLSGIYDQVLADSSESNITNI